MIFVFRAFSLGLVFTIFILRIDEPSTLSPAIITYGIIAIVFAILYAGAEISDAIKKTK
jgi:hypothetical protein